MELSFELPLFWQGSGILDSLIFNWHQFWGLPQGPRASTQNNDFDISGDSSRNFDIESSGLRVGDLRFGIKKLLTSGNDNLPAFATSLEFRLPTGNEQFSPRGIDFTADLLASKRIDKIIFYSGIYYSYFNNEFFNDIRYNQNRYGGFFTTEYAYSDSLSFLLTFLASSNLSSDIVIFPNHQVYSDIGFKYGLNKNLELEFNIRENPTPSEGSSDFSALFAFNYRN